MTSDLGFRHDEEWLTEAMHALAEELPSALTSGPRVRARSRRRATRLTLAVAATAAVATVAALPAVAGRGDGPAFEPGSRASAPPLPAPGPGQAPRAFCTLEPTPAWCTPGTNPGDGPLLRAASLATGVWGDEPVARAAVPATFGNLLVRPQDQLEAWRTSVEGGARTASIGWAVTQTVVRYRSGTVDAAYERAGRGLRIEAHSAPGGRIVRQDEGASWVWMPTVAPSGGQWMGIVRQGDLLAYLEVVDHPEGTGQARLVWDEEALGALADVVAARLAGRPRDGLVTGELAAPSAAPDGAPAGR